MVDSTPEIDTRLYEGAHSDPLERDVAGAGGAGPHRARRGKTVMMAWGATTMGMAMWLTTVRRTIQVRYT